MCALIVNQAVPHIQLTRCFQALTLQYVQEREERHCLGFHYFSVCLPRCLQASTAYRLNYRLGLVYLKLRSIDKSIQIHHIETKVVAIFNKHCKEWAPHRFSGVHVPQQH